VGLSEFSRRQAALKQELVFALLAVDGHRLQCPHPTEGVSLPRTLRSTAELVKQSSPSFAQNRQNRDFESIAPETALTFDL